MAQTSNIDGQNVGQDPTDVRFAKPPRLEVVCEFHFEPDEPWNPLVVALIGELLRDTFPESRLDPDDKDQIQFLSADGKTLVQVGEHYLAVNHQYSSWEDYVPRIFEGLHAYIEAVHPTRLSRVGLRYVNWIQIPRAGFHLNEYFNFYPFASRDVAPRMIDFSVVIRSLYEDGRDVMQIELFDIVQEDPDVSAFLLDLGYRLEPPETLEFSEVGSWLDTAHRTIKQTFLACITEELRQQFQEVS